VPSSTRLACLDRGTGTTRWTTEVGSLAFAYYFPGQTTDDIPVYRSRGSSVEVLVLDGSTGRHEYSVRLPPQTQITDVSRTTGYLGTTSQTGTTTGIAAFDVRTGRRLWARTATSDGDTQLWGGQIVNLGTDQVARQLVGRPRMVLGE
jgi:outer membrane protein assembly factor BamB